MFTASTVAAELDVLETGRAVLVDDRLRRAAELGRAATDLGDTALTLRARLLAAAMRERQGATVEAAREAWQVHAWATEHDNRPLLARCHQVLARTRRN